MVRLLVAVVGLAFNLGAPSNKIGPAWAISAEASSIDIHELECLALNIYWEARGESEALQRAVAQVVINRTRDPEFPDTICGVVEQGRSLGLCQFSWSCDGQSDRPRDEEAWERAQRIARDVIRGPADDPSNGALYFHASSARPEWRKDLQVVARIDEMVFYRPLERQTKEMHRGR